MDAVVRNAAIGIAGEMQVLAFEAGGPTRIYEADLRATTRRMLQMHHRNRVLVETSVKIEGWKVGTVDVAVAGAKVTSAYDAFLELKWGGKVDESLWDAWKLASLYKQGAAWTTYLVAGAPATNWDATKPLSCLWTRGAYKSSYLWEIAGKARWDPTKGGPALVPAGVRVHEVANLPILLTDGDPWQLRVVRITTSPGKPWVVPGPAG